MAGSKKSIKPAGKKEKKINNKGSKSSKKDKKGTGSSKRSKSGDSKKSKHKESKKKPAAWSHEAQIQYRLSDLSWVEKGCTVLPREILIRKVTTYVTLPAKPHLMFFKRRTQQVEKFYSNGSPLAVLRRNGLGNVYFPDGRVAITRRRGRKCTRLIVFHPSKNIDTDIKRDISKSKRHRSKSPSTQLKVTGVCAIFDSWGNGVIYDESGKIRLNFTQREGNLLDGPYGLPLKWKWPVNFTFEDSVESLGTQDVYDEAERPSPLDEDSDDEKPPPPPQEDEQENFKKKGSKNSKSSKKSKSSKSSKSSKNSKSSKSMKGKKKTDSTTTTGKKKSGTKTNKSPKSAGSKTSKSSNAKGKKLKRTASEGTKNSETSGKAEKKQKDQTKRVKSVNDIDLATEEVIDQDIPFNVKDVKPNENMNEDPKRQTLTDGGANVEVSAVQSKDVMEFVGDEMQEKLRQVHDLRERYFTPGVTPLKPLVMRLNKYITFRIFDQANICLEFHADQETLRIELGRVVDPCKTLKVNKVDPFKWNVDNEVPCEIELFGKRSLNQVSTILGHQRDLGLMREADKQYQKQQYGGTYFKTVI